MSHTTSHFVEWGLVLLVAGSAGCGSDLVLPQPPVGGQNVALSKADGDGQTGTVGEPLPDPLVVLVLSEDDQPVPGQEVAFELASPSDIGESAQIAVSNTDGEAITRWVLGTSTGPHVVVASLVGGGAETESTQFSAVAKAASPDTLRPGTALVQHGRRKSQVGTAPVVHVVDRYGNPVGNIPVAWQVVTGDGQLKEPITTTDADGNASAHWTLGDRIGIHKLTATIGNVSGSPVTFTATALP
jgi:hypothetical protein